MTPDEFTKKIIIIMMLANFMLFKLADLTLDHKMEGIFAYCDKYLVIK